MISSKSFSKSVLRYDEQSSSSIDSINIVGLDAVKKKVPTLDTLLNNTKNMNIWVVLIAFFGPSAIQSLTRTNVDLFPVSIIHMNDFHARL